MGITESWALLLNCNFGLGARRLLHQNGSVVYFFVHQLPEEKVGFSLGVHEVTALDL